MWHCSVCFSAHRVCVTETIDVLITGHTRSSQRRGQHAYGWHMTLCTALTLISMCFCVCVFSLCVLLRFSCERVQGRSARDQPRSVLPQRHSEGILVHRAAQPHQIQHSRSMQTSNVQKSDALSKEQRCCDCCWDSSCSLSFFCAQSTQHITNSMFNQSCGHDLDVFAGVQVRLSVSLSEALGR